MNADQLNEQFLRACDRSAGAIVALWGILDDVMDSYDLAMRSHTLAEQNLSEQTRQEIRATVQDYLANHYGV